MALLRFCKLSFAYPNANVRTLDNISLDIEDGEYIVLCGPSGCGKTTLLRHAKPELIPVGAVEGITEYQGNQISKISPFIAANEIGFVQQNPDSQIVTDFVWHELAFGLENMGLSTSAIRRRVAEMAAFFGMETWFRKKATEISGGQKQLLNLASVMAMAPRLLILDEPTAMLDPLAARTLLDTIKRINKELGVAVLLTEHRLEEVFPVADKVVLMDKGKILSCGLPENIAKTLSNSKDRSRLYFGLPAAARIGGALGCKCTPITVRDGRRELKKFLDENEIVIQKIEPSTIEKLHKNYSVKKSVVLEANNVWFRYEENGADILRGLSLELLKGDVLCLLGGNGSGKTTLMKLLAGIKKPYRGKVKIAKDSKLCMLPQNPLSLFTYDTLERELLESADGDNDRAKELAQRLELTGLLKHHPYDLSGGEVQRAAIAKLLLRCGNVLLLDEPTKGLDAYAKRSLAKILRSLALDGVSILLVTHDVEFAASYADKCALIFDGIVISTDEPHNFFAGNRFYTTDANLIATDVFPNCITCEEVIESCESCLHQNAQKLQLG